MSPRKWIERDKLAALAGDGKTAKQIAADLGCSATTVRAYASIDRVRISRRPSVGAVVSALRDGLTNAPAIAARLGLARMLVTQALVRAADKGLVVRAGKIKTAKGGGNLASVWKLTEAAQ